MKAIQLAGIICFSSLTFAASMQNVSFDATSQTQTTKKQELSKKDLLDEKLYTIQLSSTTSLRYARRIVELLPKEIQKNVTIYKIGEYFAIRYKLSEHVKPLTPDLDKIRSLGFHDALVVQTTKWHVQTERIEGATLPKEETKKQNKQEEKVSQFKIASWIAKANKAYKRGDEMSAILYYEMLLSHGYNTPAIKNNLCYLYGKQSAWQDAQKVIKKESNIFRYLYAYEYGSVENNQKAFLKDMAEDILIDKTGHLALLAGYFYEKNDNIEKALGYYKMAYLKNPSDSYNAYAYARALDIQGKKAQAIKMYKQVLQLRELDPKTKELIQRRVALLRRMQ